VRDPLGEQLVAALPLAHLPEIEHVRSGDAVPRAEAVDIRDRRVLEGVAEDLVGELLVVEAGLDHRALLGREVAHRPRQVEQRAIRCEPQRVLVVRSGNERGALGHDRQAERRRRVDVRVEEDRVVLASMRVQELEQLRHDRALMVRPRELVAQVVLFLEHVPLEGLELGIAAGGHGEAPHEKTVEEVVARPVVRGPGPVVERRRRRDLDGVMLREPLRDQARVLLGPAGDLLAVALHHHEDPPPGHGRPMR